VVYTNPPEAVAWLERRPRGWGTWSGPVAEFASIKPTSDCDCVPSGHCSFLDGFGGALEFQASLEPCERCAQAFMSGGRPWCRPCYKAYCTRM
jgi:hypothetical protein